jgi:hypothetical protein
MDSIYRSTTGEELIRRWCFDQLDGWAVPHERATVTANESHTHVVLAGSGTTTVVFVPGINFNAAASLPPAAALVAADCRVLLADVPGQPGLSSGERALSGGQLSWYGAWLSEAIERISPKPVAVMGHSVRSALGSELGVVAEAGHLVVEEQPEYPSTSLESSDRPAMHT